jgi:hypothetical protein
MVEVAMRDELHESLWRYESMTGLATRETKAIRQQERDRADYGSEHGLAPYPDGQHCTSDARKIRTGTENIIEALFDPKVGRLIHARTN